ncbi:MAG: XdhC family protein [bacterium]
MATIASVHGSTPAPVLSRLFVSDTGEAIGTVGGGCLEAEVQREAQKLRAAGGWARVVFTLTETEEELRMVCGGTVEILLERLELGDIALCELLERRTELGTTSVLARIFSDGGPPLIGTRAEPAAPRDRASGASAPARIVLGEEGEPLLGLAVLPQALHSTAMSAVRDERSAWAAGGAIYLEPVVGRPRVVLIGAGHVSRAVHAAATAAGFQVTVVDDREKYVAAERFPGARRIVLPGYAELSERVDFAPHDFVVLATRGHQYDEQVLEGLLRLPPTRYLGVIGSRRKHERAAAQLLARGIPEARLLALHAPIGLDIGAVTPEEIAVSIVAEMIAVKRRAHSAIAASLAQTKGIAAAPRGRGEGAALRGSRCDGAGDGERA